MKIKIIILSIVLLTMPTLASANSLLEDVWKKRIDLQKEFPDPKGRGISNEWTLKDWAEKFGYKEHKELMAYNKDYVYEKYMPIEKALSRISANDYNHENYHCKHFTKDLQKELDKIGIPTLKVNGSVAGSGHWWIAIQFEPITGHIIRTQEKYKTERIDISTQKFINLIR